jgi:hypothetical protein
LCQDQKARIAKTILDAYQFNTPVYAGIGIYNPGIEIGGTND